MIEQNLMRRLKGRDDFPCLLDFSFHLMTKNFSDYLAISSIFYIPLYLSIYLYYLYLTSRGAVDRNPLSLVLVSTMVVLFYLSSRWGVSAIFGWTDTILKGSEASLTTTIKNSSKQVPSIIILSFVRLLLFILLLPLLIIPAETVLIIFAPSFPLLCMRRLSIIEAIKSGAEIGRKRWLNLLTFHIFFLFLFIVLMANSLLMKRGLSFLLDLIGLEGPMKIMDPFFIPLSIVIILLFIEPLKSIYYSLNIIIPRREDR